MDAIVALIVYMLIFVDLITSEKKPKVEPVVKHKNVGPYRTPPDQVVSSATVEKYAVEIRKQRNVAFDTAHTNWVYGSPREDYMDLLCEHLLFKFIESHIKKLPDGTRNVKSSYFREVYYGAFHKNAADWVRFDEMVLISVMASGIDYTDDIKHRTNSQVNYGCIG